MYDAVLLRHYLCHRFGRRFFHPVSFQQKAPKTRFFPFLTRLKCSLSPNLSSHPCPHFFPLTYMPEVDLSLSVSLYTIKSEIKVPLRRLDHFDHTQTPLQQQKTRGQKVWTRVSPTSEEVFHIRICKPSTLHVHHLECHLNRSVFI